MARWPSQVAGFELVEGGQWKAAWEHEDGARAVVHRNRDEQGRRRHGWAAYVLEPGAHRTEQNELADSVGKQNAIDRVSRWMEGYIDKNEYGEFGGF